MSGPFPATERQQDLLRFVYGYQLTHGGVAPSYEEICADLGLAARSGVVRLLNGLEERGHIRRLPRRARAIEVLHPPTIPRAPDGAPLFFVPIALPEGD